MKIIIILLLLFLIYFRYAAAQGLTIGSETTLSLGYSTLYLSNNWNNSGILNAEYGTIVFNGDGDQAISSTNEEIFSFLVVDKNTGDLHLLNNITVNGSVDIVSGDIDGNNNILTLGEGLNGIFGAHFNETPGNTFKGGIVNKTVLLDTPNEINLLGIVITSQANLGNTTVSRGHYIQTGNNAGSILRYYDITPANNNDLDATIIFGYDESELAGLSEEELILFKSDDEGETWSEMGGELNVQTKTVTLHGIDSFSRWTLASVLQPIPVELASFTAVPLNSSVKLNWLTVSETNNKGFEIERKILNDAGNNLDTKALNYQWSQVGYVEGSGTSTEPKSYSFIDKNPLGGVKFSYRLKQVDMDGKYQHSNEVEVDLTPGNYYLYQNYPNPFNPVTIINYQLPEDDFVSLKIFDVLGNEIVTLVEEEKTAGYYEVKFNAVNFASGTYYFHLKTGSFNQVKKMILLR